MEPFRHLYIMTNGTMRFPVLAFLSDEEAEFAAGLFDLDLVAAIWDDSRIRNYSEELRREAGIPEASSHS